MTTNNNRPTKSLFGQTILVWFGTAVCYVLILYAISKPYRIKRAAEDRAVVATANFVLGNWPAYPITENCCFNLGKFHDQHWYYTSGAYSNLNDLRDTLHKTRDPMVSMDYPATIEENKNIIETRIIHNISTEKSLTNGYFLIVYEPTEG